jgi:integrase/recombinase XerD
MLERYFIRPDTVDRIRSSWLGDAIQTYVAWLAGQSYSSRCVIRRVPLFMRVR